MRKLSIAIFALASLILGACSNLHALEYNSDKAIAQGGDNYLAIASAFSSTDNGFLYTAYRFDGRETLWEKELEENQDIEIDFSFSLTEGQAKIVLIDGQNDVTTLFECSPDAEVDTSVTKTISLKSGQNTLKIVGHDCENVDLELLFSQPVQSVKMSGFIHADTYM